MRYLPTALGRLAFAWKLYNYGHEGKINIDELRAEVTWQKDDMFFIVPKALDCDDDLLITLQNNLTITFGAAAITFNRTREELEIRLPYPIDSELEQCIALIYQIRNAFSHDIVEPRWKVNGRYKGIYEVAGVHVDLSS